ncbi:hypothetical protein LWI28_011829 [Acer negundo]|uniref:RING-type E3 ubiquitin transferase n=1 Tax=Acer negundo TaxID=4023 RepID=A0AAD5IQR2_ACENE|nr:hypothetical protein LWI28_011829 [Acer negundo]KAK4843397.1 hypothetical protein QYF36_007623 [Acer negundo]
MSSSHQLFFFFFLIFFSVIHISTSVNTCPISCHATGLGPVIRFPFRRKDQPFPCGYPGFELSCNSRSQTILNLPKLGNFTVQNIDYQSQTIWINDPDYCLPKRLLRSFSLSDTPFNVENLMEFTFYNCSSVGNTAMDVPGSRMVSCMSGDNFTVVAVPTYWSNVSGQGIPGSCSVIDTVVIPFFWPSWSGLEQGVPLKWDDPDCKSCEERRGTCGFENDISPIFIVGCANLPGFGLPRSAKYGIIIGVAIPGLLCFIGIACYLCGRVRNYYHRRRHHSGTEFMSTSTQQSMVILTGLDTPTIESYPKTLLGESRRLPKPSDNTCSICLCEYQPKEILRTIPECNHYFHVSCIDEWLRLNATCPMCRNSPEGSTIVALSTSTSSSSSSLL